MSDHKAQAEIRLPRRGDPIYPNAVAVAQVHATLYLAEQQRVSNAIAMAAIFTSGVKPDQDYWTKERLVALGKLASEGLGL